MVDIGQKTEVITWRQQVRTQRSDGGYNLGTPTDTTIWASVQPVRATEQEIANRLAGKTTYLVELERDELPSGYDTDDSIVWEGLVLNIREIRLPRTRDMHVVIVAEAGVVE